MADGEAACLWRKNLLQNEKRGPDLLSFHSVCAKITVWTDPRTGDLLVHV